MRELWMRFLRYFGLAKEQPQTYIVLHRVPLPTPAETVTAWHAYEAAPQEAKSPLEAIAKFQSDSQLTGVFLAIPQQEYDARRATLVLSGQGQ